MRSNPITDQINEQKTKVKLGSPKIEIIAPCIVNDGIIALNSDEQSRLITLFDEYQKELLLFIPASGSGSRMFDFLLSSDNDLENDPKVKLFLDHLNQFAFFDEQAKSFYDKWLKGQLKSGDLIQEVLGGHRGGFLKSPKGLIPFHRINKGSLNAFQEHLLQGMNLGTQVKYHFTIQESFKEDFLSSLRDLNKRFKYDCEVAFSFQDQGTDSFAFDQAYEPLITDKEALLRRPAGHGALIENLVQLTDQYVLIKNIDNVQHIDRSDTSNDIWKTLCGILFEVKSKLRTIYLNPQFDSLHEFNKTYHLFTGQQLDACHDEKSIKVLLEKPLRVCGMVHNEGKAGGGPFFVRTQNGSITKQIIEAVQVSQDKGQMEQLELSTHFNPVMMVLDLFDFNDEKYDLKSFRNDDNYFVVNKKFEGKDISFMELPGLWNGAMYDWNTLFVEIPIATFTPVKTVLDLLGENHQSNQ
jgi:hypothetical protein